MNSLASHPSPERLSADELPPAFDLQPFDHTTVVLAHPDDELLVGGAIASLVDIGQPLDVIVLSDGEQSTRGNRAFVSSGRRREESIAALEVYDIAIDHQHYFGLPDAHLSEPTILDAAAQKLGRFLIKKESQVVLTTGSSGYDEHADHIAAHTASVLAVSAIRSLDRAVTPTVWELSRRPGEETFAISDEMLYIKLAALSRHRSQFTLGSAEPFKGPGYVTLGGYDLHPETAQHLAPYRELFAYESYVRTRIPAAITPAVGYTTSRERELVS